MQPVGLASTRISTGYAPKSPRSPPHTLLIVCGALCTRLSCTVGWAWGRRFLLRLWWAGASRPTMPRGWVGRARFAVGQQANLGNWGAPSAEGRIGPAMYVLPMTKLPNPDLCGRIKVLGICCQNSPTILEKPRCGLWHCGLFRRYTMHVIDNFNNLPMI